MYIYHPPLKDPPESKAPPDPPVHEARQVNAANREHVVKMAPMVLRENVEVVGPPDQRDPVDQVDRLDLRVNVDRLENRDHLVGFVDIVIFSEKQDCIFFSILKFATH